MCPQKREFAHFYLAFLNKNFNVHLGIYMYGNKRLTSSSDVNVLFIIIIACTFFYYVSY